MMKWEALIVRRGYLKRKIKIKTRNGYVTKCRYLRMPQRL